MEYRSLSSHPDFTNFLGPKRDVANPFPYFRANQITDSFIKLIKCVSSGDVNLLYNQDLVNS